MTNVQRQVLLWIADNGGSMLITSGYQTTQRGTVRGTQVPAIGTSIVVIEPLVRHGWIRRVDGQAGIGAGDFEITDAGRTALSPNGVGPFRRLTRTRVARGRGRL